MRLSLDMLDIMKNFYINFASEMMHYACISVHFFDTVKWLEITVNYSNPPSAIHLTHINSIESAVYSIDSNQLGRCGVPSSQIITQQ